MTLRRLISIAILFVLPATLRAQIDPSHSWYTIKTAHFYVHFTRPTEALARRLAGHAEEAYGRLAAKLHPPRGMIDLVVTDDVDLSNGSATPFPTPRIVIYANPPVSESALRYTNDWGQLVITHELTHIFHLDRTRGVWALSQKIFGRAAALFPNFYDPAWVTEGVAVYEESKVAGAGRIEGSEHRMIARSAAIDNRFPAIGSLSLAQGRFPFGESAYAYGSLFIDHLARSRGDTTVRQFIDKSAANLIPYLINIPAKQSFGTSFSAGWKEFRDSVARSIRVAPSAPIDGWRELTRDGVFVFDPRWQSDSTMIYSGTSGRESFAAFRVDLSGRRRRVGRRNGQSANVPFGDGLLFSQLEFTNLYTQRSDLWVQRGRSQRRLTYNERLTNPDARADGEIVAVQIFPGATRLVRVSRDGKRIVPLTTGSYDEQWTEPRWSRSGQYIAASRWLRGNISQIVVVDTTGRIIHVASSGNSIEATPSWLRDDMGILYSSDRDGTAQLYAEQFTAPNTFAGARTFRVSNTATGMFDPIAAPSSNRIAGVLFRSDGYHLGVGTCCGATTLADGTGLTADAGRSPVSDVVPAAPYLDSASRRTNIVPVDTSTATRYSPWRTFWPRYWLPSVDQGIRGTTLYGATTRGFDVVGRHRFNAGIWFPTHGLGGITGNGAYIYSGLGQPILQVDAGVDWASLGGIFARDAARTQLGELFRKTVFGDVLASVIRQRYRSVMALTGGFGMERFTHTATGGVAIADIDTTGRFGTLTYPSLVAQATFSNYQRPAFSISPEDGVQLSVTVRDRLRSGFSANGGQTFSTVGSASLYKSLNLPGFAHHVLALRGVAGYADERTPGYYFVGGVSGNPFEIIPGYSIGEGRKQFPVRGFAPGTLAGTRATAASVEYRIPLFLMGGSPGILPFFFDRSFITLFGDYGWAECPNVKLGREVCNQAGQDRSADIGSIGGELNLNLGVLSWDSPYRFRLGVVHPVQNGAFFGRQMVQVYFVTGVSF